MTAILDYDWDEDKAQQNLEKHNVTFKEAATIFEDPMYITLIDDEHSIDEERYVTIDLSSRGRLLMVAHTERSDRTRLISARKATRNEEQYYAEAD